MERYFRVNKDIAARAGYDEVLRTAIDDDLLLSERDLRNITLTCDERARGIGAIEFTQDDFENLPADEPQAEPEDETENETEDNPQDEPEINEEKEVTDEQ